MAGRGLNRWVCTVVAMSDEQVAGGGQIGLIHLKEWLGVRPQCDSKDEFASLPKKRLIYPRGAEGSIRTDIEKASLSTLQVPFRTCASHSFKIKPVVLRCHSPLAQPQGLVAHG